MSNSIRIIIRKDWEGSLGFSIICGCNTQHPEQLIYETKWHTIKEGELLNQPSFKISAISANEFMLSLKEAIREYEGSTPDFSQGELKATKYHLEDCRKLLKLKE